MIYFLNGDVRAEFHLLTLDKQRAMMDFADELNVKAKKLTVLFVDSIGSEISIRIDDKLDDAS